METAVLVELERRGMEVGYVKTNEGFEVDFLARHSTRREELIQVCSDVRDVETIARELRALTEAQKLHPRAMRRLLVLDRDALTGVNAPDVIAQPAYEWLLEPGKA